MVRDTVMVVRETASLADSVQELLLSEGYRIRAVPSAREGRKLLESARGRGVRATVIVCNEPVCSGVETLTASTSDTPVIVVGWRGAPCTARGATKLLLLRLPISAGTLLSSLRSIVHDGTVPGAPVAT
ncbi:MAG TPA: hypothetical protein VEY07_01670 [Thermoplasmata archaeon]|nr:hypothetical protein [Thermoplasmata archaeon]